ncbi:Protein STB5 [Diaporthe amygdali]|uniref:Protein STB5 n=1 Tax=Phomopsis amygdali TaxID=1214568 RepID=UPI0022FE22E7|nr:Protein STB5 [Diaporthe amygdali]KAJ0104014.1 Protein STB5 [Diaporthe amygdali]
MEPSSAKDSGLGSSRSQAFHLVLSPQQPTPRREYRRADDLSLTFRTISFKFNVVPDGDETSNLTNATLGSYVESLKNTIEQGQEPRRPRKRARTNGDSSLITSPSPDLGGDDTPTAGSHRLDSHCAETATPQLAQHDDDDNTLRGHPTQTTNVPCEADTADCDGEASVRASLSGISFLSQDAMAEPRGDGFANIPQRIGMANLVKAATALDGADPARPTRPDPSLSVLMTMAGGATEDLQMNRKATEKFMNLFLDEVAILYPYFDRERIEGQYQLVVHDENEPPRNRAYLPSDADKFSTYMALCIGTLLSSESMRLESYRTKLRKTSLGLLYSLLEDGDSLVPIMCLILLTIYATLSSDGGSAWQLLGLGMRQCIFMGLHRESEQYTKAEMDTRRRLFWTMYILDRLADNHKVMSQPSSIRLEQNSARILTHIAYAALLTTEGHTANSSSVFDMETMSDEISMACKRFVDSLYDRSDQTHFVGSFVDAYDIFVSGMFYIYLEQRHGSDAQNYESLTKPDGVRGGHAGLVNDMVNKCSLDGPAGYYTYTNQLVDIKSTRSAKDEADTDLLRPADASFFLHQLGGKLLKTLNTDLSCTGIDRLNCSNYIILYSVD